MLARCFKKQIMVDVILHHCAVPGPGTRLSEKGG